MILVQNLNEGRRSSDALSAIFHVGFRVAVVLGIFAITACTTTSSSNGGSSDPPPPIESESEEIQEEFDAAFELLVDKKWDQAAEAFRLLQAEHAGDITAELAELYIARALLRDVDARFTEGIDSDGAQPVGREVFTLLEPLADTARNGGDVRHDARERIRYGAQVYLAIAHALNGDVDQVVDVFSHYPGASIGSVVLEQDLRWAWPLVAEGLTQAERHGEAVVAWGKLHGLLRYEADEDRKQDFDEDFDDSAEWFGGRDLSPKADLAVTRAFEAENHLTESDIRRFLGHDQPLVRAVGAWTIIRRGIADAPGEEAVVALQTVFNELSPDFLAINAADRASELSAALAGISGADRLVIGAILPLSGPNRAVGYRALAGMLIAQRAFHVAGEPAVTLIIEDSHGDVVGAYERLVAEDALVVVGPLATIQARELIEPAARHNVPVMALAADRIAAIEEVAVDDQREQAEEEDGRRASDAENADILDDLARDDVADDEELEAIAPQRRPPIFRNFVDSIAEARAAAVVAFDVLGDRRAAIVFPDMGYGRTMARAFAEEFRRQGGEIIVEVEYERQASDFVSTARTVSRAEPDVIFLPDTGSKVAEISAFFAQENIWGVSADEPSRVDGRIYVHYLGTSLWQDSIVLHQAASYVEGALVPAWYSPVFNDADTRQFSQGFEAIYGSRPDHFVAFAYDSVNHLRTLFLQRGVTNSQGVVEALEQREWAQGATGRHYFGDDGEPRRQLRYLTVDDGQWSIFDWTVSTPLEGRQEIEEALGDELESLDEESTPDLDSDRTDGS